MHTLRSSLTTYPRWWLLGGLGLLVCVAGLFALRTCQAQPAPPARTAAPAPVATATTVAVLTWDYTPAAPAHFVIRRSIEGGTWADVAKLPGASGTGLTWKDTTLPASPEPMTVKYVVYAAPPSGDWSEASNIAVTVVGEEPPVALGECVAVKRGKKKIIITCAGP